VKGSNKASKINSDSKTRSVMGQYGR